MTPPVNVIALMTRTKNKPLKLDAGVEIQVKSLSLNALELLQKEVDKYKDDANPRAQFLPVLRASVVGLEEVTEEDIGGFLLEDLRTIADRVMEVGK